MVAPTDCIACLRREPVLGAASSLALFGWCGREARSVTHVVDASPQIRATVVIATHDRGPLLAYAVASALAQTVEEIEVLIAGDGVTDSTREAIAELVRQDGRVRFLDKPKAPHRGEANRHATVLQARGEIVCHLDDDDLWLPDHVETMLSLLAEADLAVTLPVLVLPGDEIVPFPIDLANPVHRVLFAHPSSYFVSSPTFVGYRASMYRQLREGWSPPRVGRASDKYLWAQFLANPACRAVSTFRPTAVGLPSPVRSGHSLHQRAEEHRCWAERLADPEQRERFHLDIVAGLARDHVERLTPLWAAYGLVLRMPLISAWLVQAGRHVFGRRGLARRISNLLG
jgi:glycosyltransferase involved in cell wall biosynthesis